MTTFVSVKGLHDVESRQCTFLTRRKSAVQIRHRPHINYRLYHTNYFVNSTIDHR